MREKYSFSGKEFENPNWKREHYSFGKDAKNNRSRKVVESPAFIIIAALALVGLCAWLIISLMGMSCK